MGRMTPGIGEGTPDQKRAAAIERFLGRYPEQRIIARSAETGLLNEYWALARLGPPVNNVALISEGAFYTIITDGDGNKFLQGGSVNGVGVTTTSLKIFDPDPAPDGTWEGTNDQQLYLSVAGTGTVADGVLLPGFDITSITPTIGTPPESTPPTKDVSTGTCIITLGTFFNEAFFPDNIGSFTVAVCIGGFVVSRI